MRLSCIGSARIEFAPDLSLPWVGSALAYGPKFAPAGVLALFRARPTASSKPARPTASSKPRAPAQHFARPCQMASTHTHIPVSSAPLSNASSTCLSSPAQHSIHTARWEAHSLKRARSAMRTHTHTCQMIQMVSAQVRPLSAEHIAYHILNSGQKALIELACRLGRNPNPVSVSPRQHASRFWRKCTLLSAVSVPAG